jgi:hypothetical protein
VLVNRTSQSSAAARRRGALLSLLCIFATGCQVDPNALGGLGGLGGGYGGGFGGGGLGGGLGGLGGGGGFGGSNFNNPGYTPFTGAGGLGGLGPRSPTGGGFGGGYGNLNTPGTGGLPPRGALPPPRAIPGQYAQVFRKYGVQVDGPGAGNPNALETVSQALQHYNVNNTRGLRAIHLLTSSGSSMTGLWMSKGSYCEINLYGRNRPQPVGMRTAVHELGHHWSLYSDRQAGNAFDQALGNGAQAYVSPYAQKSRSEKLAEAVAFLLVGPQVFRQEMSILPGFRPSQQAVGIVQQRIVAGR